MKKTVVKWEQVKALLPTKVSLYYVDYNSNLDEHMELFEECLETKSFDPIDGKIDDWYCDSPHYAIGELNEELLRDMCDEFEIEEDEAAEIMEEFFDDIRDHYHDNDDSNVLKDLLRNTSDIPVRITMYSNFDCINSHWFETQYNNCYEYKETYFGAMVDALQLNPKDVKQMLIKQGYKPRGQWTNKPNRDPLVTLKDFWQELQNSSCGANNLVFVGEISAMELYNNNFNVTKITVPKGNSCGLYSSFQGGGSVIEMELQRAFEIDLSKHGATKYDKYGLNIDYRGGSGYSINEAYGVTTSFWGGQLTIQ